jgi:predicted  nucleic acid-binding Zn-ribbon protein
MNKLERIIELKERITDSLLELKKMRINKVRLEHLIDMDRKELKKLKESDDSCDSVD